MLSAENSDQSQDPWTLVETAAPPFNRGFVPTSYLISVETEEHEVHQVEQSIVETPLNEYSETIREGGPIRRLSDPRLPHQLLQVLSIHPPEEHLQQSSHALAKSEPTSSAQSYQHLLSQHDKQFQQVMHLRHEQFRALEEAADDLTRRIEASKLKSSEIAGSMLDLTAIIEGERKKWKEKLNEIYQEL